jgi:Zn finger protein HypA/HybF involved in hydrogenase expression
VTKVTQVDVIIGKVTQVDVTLGKVTQVDVILGKVTQVATSNLQCQMTKACHPNE